MMKLDFLEEQDGKKTRILAYLEVEELEKLMDRWSGGEDRKRHELLLNLLLAGKVLKENDDVKLPDVSEDIRVSRGGFGDKVLRHVESMLEKAQSKQKAGHLLRILEFIDENSRYELTLPKICRIFSVGRTWLTYKLKHFTGCSFKELLRRVRVKNASLLLLETSLSMTEISERTGFGNERTMRYNFNKELGCSPREHKKLMSILEEELQEESGDKDKKPGKSGKKGGEKTDKRTGKNPWRKSSGKASDKGGNKGNKRGGKKDKK